MKDNVGDNIRKYREMNHLSQKQLASKLGITNSRISNWEQGANNPPADMIADICEAQAARMTRATGMKYEADVHIGKTRVNARGYQNRGDDD